MLFCCVCGAAQQQDSVWLRSFRITDYLVSLNDSTVVVQIHPADGVLLKEKQLGMARGVFREQSSDTVAKGYGRLQLIKGDYYYFSIGHNTSKTAILPGDLLYTFVPATPNCSGSIPRLALHSIVLTDVYDQPFYDSLRIFEGWDIAQETRALDTMLKDIRFTAGYFLQNQPSMNVKVSSGPFLGEKVLEVMQKATVADLKDFIGYMIARPRIYAGRVWKLSEIFATWVVNGAPAVVK